VGYHDYNGLSWIVDYPQASRGQGCDDSPKVWRRYGTSHTLSRSWIIVDNHGLCIIADYCGLSWIMDYRGLWLIIMDYHRLPWIIMDYHGLWIVVDYHGLS
jgi:hypothetical protein